MQFQILGIGAWGPGFQNWSGLSAILAGQPSQDSAAKGPTPEVIPPNERRRAPLSVRLAVEASWQAVQHAQLDPAELPSVFVSGLGDTQLTDYMCRTLAGDNKALSPTKFHNSVHNAAAGYWTISTGCMQAANSIAGFQESVSLTLMEAIIQCQSEQRPILITFYDSPSSEVLMELLHNEHPFAVSIVIAPAAMSVSATSASLPSYVASINNDAVSWPTFESAGSLEQCYKTNPAARILPFLKAIALRDSGEPIAMPLSSQSTLSLTLV